MGKGGVAVLGGPRRLSAAEAEEGSAKKMRAEPEAAATATKKTKKVMRRLAPDYVDYVLAMKPQEPRFQPKRVSEESRRRGARVDELIRASDDLIQSIQEYYRRELHAKGYVEVEEEVQDDDFEAEKAPANEE